MSEECDRIKGKYASGTYLHAFKEAKAFLRAKLPNVRPDDLKSVPSLADKLELSGSKDGGPGGDDGDDLEEDDVQIDITNLDPPLGQIE